jgi:hypothetical protein
MFKYQYLQENENNAYTGITDQKYSVVGLASTLKGIGQMPKVVIFPTSAPPPPSTS